MRAAAEKGAYLYRGLLSYPPATTLLGASASKWWGRHQTGASHPRVDSRLMSGRAGPTSTDFHPRLPGLTASHRSATYLVRRRTLTGMRDSSREARPRTGSDWTHQDIPSHLPRSLSLPPIICTSVSPEVGTSVVTCAPASLQEAPRNHRRRRLATCGAIIVASIINAALGTSVHLLFRIHR